MTNKDFCISSYLAFRYIEDDEKDFFKNGVHHQNFSKIDDKDRLYVKSAKDIDDAIRLQFNKIENKKLGILLSGGMDSAILASYIPPKSNAYTFRFLGGKFQKEELERAEYYANYYDLKLNYVDINWNDTVEQYIDKLMEVKGAPVHSIEPQILQAVEQAKKDGVEVMITGAISDLTFGGMDQLLSKDWSFDDFVKRYTYLDPKQVVNNPIDMSYLFERYRKGENIDFLKFLDDVAYVECESAYENAFKTGNIEYLDPYARLKMAEPLDLSKVRNGNSKYLIRELFSKKYPNYPVPDKNPMPRPVDEYFKNWTGPKRNEFKKDLNMKNFSGNQKWLMYCLERFLNNNEKR